MTALRHQSDSEVIEAVEEAARAACETLDASKMVRNCASVSSVWPMPV